jgi:hypothetical protein
LEAEEDDDLVSFFLRRGGVEPALRWEPRGDGEGLRLESLLFLEGLALLEEERLLFEDLEVSSARSSLTPLSNFSSLGRMLEPGTAAFLGCSYLQLSPWMQLPL